MASADVMSACENVCRDFSTWFPLFASVAADVATVLGVGAAIIFASTWARWKRQTLAHKGHSIALDCLEDLRKFQNCLNAARIRPTLSVDYTDADFDKAFRHLTEAGQICSDITLRCELIADLGIDSEAIDAANKLVYLQGRVRRPLQRARDAHNTWQVDQKFNHLSEFFWSLGSETALDKDVDQNIEQLRITLRRIARMPY